jgi:predicted MFS family arabinose efflux permease
MAFGWGATLILVAIVVWAIALFWMWWRHPNKGSGGKPHDAATDAAASTERLDLLRSARQWGDVSTTSDSYLRRNDN